MIITYAQNARVPSERTHAYQIAHTCAGLVHAGHKVTLLTPARKGVTADTYEAYGFPPGLFVHERLACPDPLTGRKRFLAFAYAAQRWCFIRALRKRVRTIASDIWYTRDAALIDGLPRIKGPWVLELHDAVSDTRRWERIKPRVTHFIAISTGVKEWLTAHGIPEDRITIAQDGFDPRLFQNLPSRTDARNRLNLPQDAFVLAYTGSCYPWKGVDLAVSAWNRTPQNAHLVVAGAGDEDLARLRSLAPAAAKERIHFLPSMPREELKNVFAAANAGLLPTSPHHEIGNRYTSPLKQFEYLAAGLPVLASNVPSSHDVLTPDVARFFDDTEDAFAAATKDLMAETAWRAAASTHARNTAAPYTWDARAKRIANALERLV